MLNIVIFGPPGVGKGTQSNLLIEKYKLKHFSTGDILRDERNKGSELGLVAAGYHEKGNLVPSDLINQIMGKVITENITAPGFIFDGYPRRVDQAVYLDTTLDSSFNHIALVIALDADESILKERLLERGKTSGRPDDQDVSIIETRIKVYKEETLPVLEYYKFFGKTINIDGSKSVDEIFEIISERINHHIEN